MTRSRHCLAAMFVVLATHASNGEETVSLPTAAAASSLYAVQIDIVRGVVTEDSKLLRSCLKTLDVLVESHPEDAVSALANGGLVCERLPDEDGCVEWLVRLCQLPLTDRQQIDLRQEFVRKAYDRIRDAKRKEWIKAIVNRTLEQPGPYGDVTLIHLVREAWMASGAYPSRWALVSRITEHVRPALNDAGLDGEFRDYLRNQFRELEWLAIQTHHDACELGPLWKSVRKYLEEHGSEDPHSMEALTKGLKATCHCKKNKLAFDPAVLPSDEWMAKWRSEFAAMPASAVEHRKSYLTDAWTEWDVLMVEQRHKTGWLTIEELRSDLRLQSRISGDFKNPTIDELLKWMKTASLVPLEMADPTASSWKGTGNFRKENVPVCSVMEYFMVSPTLQGRWFSEADRIVLHVTLPQPKPLQPTTVKRSWRWSMIGANALAVGLMLAMLVWRRRSTARTGTRSQGD